MLNKEKSLPDSLPDNQLSDFSPDEFLFSLPKPDKKKQKQLKPVYFNTVLEADLLEWVNPERVNNFSEYIKGLIRRDMTFAERGVDPQVLTFIEDILEAKLAERTVFAGKKSADQEGIEQLIEGFF